MSGVLFLLFLLLLSLLLLLLLMLSISCLFVFALYLFAYYSSSSPFYHFSPFLLFPASLSFLLLPTTPSPVPLFLLLYLRSSSSSSRIAFTAPLPSLNKTSSPCRSSIHFLRIFATIFGSTSPLPSFPSFHFFLVHSTPLPFSLPTLVALPFCFSLFPSIHSFPSLCKRSWYTITHERFSFVLPSPKGHFLLSFFPLASQLSLYFFQTFPHIHALSHNTPDYIFVTGATEQAFSPSLPNRSLLTHKTSNIIKYCVLHRQPFFISEF
ncbi:MAG: hypothetical protein JOS17DRAFT_423708 [Linnemannia elongata]|nr:MAG: hypothetical protein JOS17DRAFT_423708 [Linnemannia elongata]